MVQFRPATFFVQKNIDVFGELCIRRIFIVVIMLSCAAKQLIFLYFLPGRVCSDSFLCTKAWLLSKYSTGLDAALVWMVVSWTGMYQYTLHCWTYFLWFVLLDSLTSSIGYMHSLVDVQSYQGLANSMCEIYHKCHIN